MVRYLCAVDGSTEAGNAFQWVMQYAIPGKDVVYVLGCVEASYTAVGALPGLPAVDVNLAILDAEKNRMRTLLKKYDAICKERKLECVALLDVDSPRDSIVAHVERYGIDTCVIGSRGMGGMKRLLLGSVSDYVVHNAKCVCVIVKVPVEHKELPKEQQAVAPALTKAKEIQSPGLAEKSVQVGTGTPAAQQVSGRM